MTRGISFDAAQQTIERSLMATRRTDVCSRNAIQDVIFRQDGQFLRIEIPQFENVIQQTTRWQLIDNIAE